MGGCMKVSDYQVSNVVRTYVKNARLRIKGGEASEKVESVIGDTVRLSQEGLRKVRERIDETVRSKVRKHEETA